MNENKTTYKEVKILRGLNISENNFINKWLKKEGFDDEAAEYLLHPAPEDDWKELPGAEWLVHEILALPDDSRITILGDYDADGITSTTILFHAMKLAGKENVNYLIPHRIRDGYGISKDLVDKVQELNEGRTDVIITCDNGVNNFDAVDYARGLGIQVIVTDHHTIDKDSLLQHLDGLALVHPHYGKASSDKDEPVYRSCVEISGAQVAYKIYQGVRAHIQMPDEEEQKILDAYMLQLATISIISDVMPIASIGPHASMNHNRAMLKRGLESLRTVPDKHISILMDMLDISCGTVMEETIAFYLAPVLNASGRLANAEIAVRALIESDPECIQMHMSGLVYLNEERKKLKAVWLEEARKKLNEEDTWNCICLEGVHEGIVGILAGQIADETGKPTIVLTPSMKDGKKIWKGSGRSAGTVSMYDWIANAKGHILAFGGHEGAVGLSVADEELNGMKSALPSIPSKAVNIKYVLPLSESLISTVGEDLKEYKPFGNGLNKPLCRTTFTVKAVDLFFKSNSVKFATQQGLEFWLYKKADEILEKIPEWNLNLVRSNLDKRQTEMGYQEAFDGRWEKYMPKFGNHLSLTCVYYLDWGYDLMGSEGVQIQLVDLLEN